MVTLAKFSDEEFVKDEALEDLPSQVLVTKKTGQDQVRGPYSIFLVVLRDSEVTL
jgi:hypothetical protein